MYISHNLNSFGSFVGLSDITHSGHSTQALITVSEGTAVETPFPHREQWITF